MKKIALLAFLICLLPGLAFAQSIPGIAAPAPQSWTGPGVLGRDISQADSPILLLPSQSGATETLLQFSGTNAAASTRWIQVFKSNTAPANGTLPLYEIQVSTGNSFGWYGYPVASLVATGWAIACSTTQGTLTLTATNDCFFSAKVSP